MKPTKACTHIHHDSLSLFRVEQLSLCLFQQVKSFWTSCSMVPIRVDHQRLLSVCLVWRGAVKGVSSAWNCQRRRICLCLRMSSSVIEGSTPSTSYGLSLNALSTRSHCQYVQMFGQCRPSSGGEVEASVPLRLSGYLSPPVLGSCQCRCRRRVGAPLRLPCL